VKRHVLLGQPPREVQHPRLRSATPAGHKITNKSSDLIATLFVKINIPGLTFLMG